MRIKTCDEVLNKLLEIGDSVDNPADIDVYWKFTDKANIEYARKRNVSEYITFAGVGKIAFCAESQRPERPHDYCPSNV